jgi:tetratricopeptide (TPR) repeat protein
MSENVFELFNQGVQHSLDAHQHREQGKQDRAAGSEQDAAAMFQRVLELDAEHTGAIGGLALCYCQLGRPQDAAKLFQKAIQLDSGSAENHKQLGLCFIELGDVGAAREAILRAVEIDGNPDYRRDIAVEVYNFGGYIMQMAAQFRDNEEEDRDSEQEDEERGCYRLAEQVFKLVVELDGRNPHGYKALSIVKSCLE